MATVEFRDGRRDVPEHVEAILKGIPTHTMTYEQAIAAANNRMLGSYVGRAQDSIVSTHFRNNGGRGNER